MGKRGRESGKTFQFQNLRRILWEEQNETCYLCKKKINWAMKRNHPMSCTVDHVLPESEGGYTEKENLKVAHKCCNEKKANFYSVDMAING